MSFKPLYIALLLTELRKSSFKTDLNLTQLSCFFVIVIFVLVLWAAYRIRLRSHTERINNMVVERLSEREQIAHELNDTLLQGMQGLILLFQGAVVETPLKTLVASRLETAIDRAERLIVEAQDRVRDLHAPNLDLADSLRGLIAERPPSGASYSMKVIGRVRELQPLISDEVFKIASEVIASAFLHTSVGHVDVTLTYRHTSLRLIVADDGSDVLEEGGSDRPHCSAMKSRARRLEGTLLILNGSPIGTEVQLVVPSRVAYRLQISFLSEWLQTVKHFLERRGR